MTMLRNPTAPRAAYLAPSDGATSVIGGALVSIDGERYYRISNPDRMPPFLVNLVSDDDLWMFVASNGAVTAGRCNPDHALFPYYTQDKLFDLADSVGAVSLIHVGRAHEEGSTLWEPWTPHLTPGYSTGRSLLKNRTGSSLIFEEALPDSGLVWRHQWSFSARFGIVRRAEITNRSSEDVDLRLLDGLRNILPCGLGQVFQNQFSNLADAYKRSERLDVADAALFYLSSIPTDRAEPSEGLRANVVWSTGIVPSACLLSTAQLERFRNCGRLRTESDVRGQRGAYLLEASFALAPGESRVWWMAADLGLDAARIVELEHWLRETRDHASVLAADVGRTARGLQWRIGQGDGLQSSADELRCWRHASNALFNIMRGGVFAHDYAIPTADFSARLGHFNRAAFDRHRDWIADLPDLVARGELEAMARDTGDLDLIRLVGEYLPLTFSRRHGDPSRPWNRFSIETRDSAGRPRYVYEGNWRDIFQNWEALLVAFPGFTESAILRFLNATTADGHNPYRITQLGFEWESITHGEPWANIGYWGDHQIIYLLKLLEHSLRIHPTTLPAMLDEETFTYAHVPYRIRSYDAILADPRNTIDFDDAAAWEIDRRVREIGADGRLLHRADGSLVRAGLAEKLLVPLLAKLANFVPGGGIWMNTQRPEWNDANNALVGHGVSVVTLGYVHRYLLFLIDLFEQPDAAPIHTLSADVARWIAGQRAALEHARPCLDRGFSASDRQSFVDALGRGAANYREALYARGLSHERTEIAAAELVSFMRTAADFVRHSLLANQRDDGLFHSYNVLAFEAGGGVTLERLDEMLEGQVSILSSRLLDPAGAVRVLDALRASRLYRDERRSYLLYPDRDLPRFLEKNKVPGEEARRSRLLCALLDTDDRSIVTRDLRGNVRFNGDFRNVADLRLRLSQLANPRWRAWAGQEASLLEEIFESTFRHRAFTGRSSTFFAYEGLGSVYWHMVSKLVLAIQENHRRAVDEAAGTEVIQRLARHYHETLEGLGIHKSPADYGAFPTDAYSHTPAHAGAQQPGMTGQVKEDLLVRWGELGVSVLWGRASFVPRLLSRAEFHTAAATFTVHDLAGRETALPLRAGSLAFTLCQVPVVYVLARGGAVEVHGADGTVVRRDEPRLSFEESDALFERKGSIARIVVSVDASLLQP